MCVFLVTRPFTWYHSFWPYDLDLEVWPTFEKLKSWLLLNDGCRPASIEDKLLLKTLTLAITLKLEVIRLSYYTCVLVVTRPFTCYYNFLSCDHDLEIWLTCEKNWTLLLFNYDCRLASVVVFWQLIFRGIPPSTEKWYSYYLSLI